ncbi:MAG: hypothetical protein GY940_16340, partial [bacterium]|nr:hypothetical protein [bacterium]
MNIEEIVANLVKKVERRFYGKYRGFVVKNNDPEKLGRLKVTVPSVLGKEVVTGWAWPCTPYGGSAGAGLLAIPEKDAGVWIEFEEGDPEFPIWVGTFWSKPKGKSELPKTNKADGSEEDSVQKPPSCKVFKTVAGHSIQMEDKKGDEMLTIVEGKNKHVIVLDKDGIKITDGANEHVVTLDDEGIALTDGANKHEVVLSSSGITVTDAVGGNTIDMTDSGIKVSDKAGNVINMKSSGVTIKSNAIKVGGSAAEPLVLGNKLTSVMNTFVGMLNAHVHVGNLGAPTGPPTPPATLVLTPALSVK